MARYVPGQSGAVIQWIWSGGTATLNTDYRNGAYNSSADLIDSSAGNDGHMSRLPTLGDGQVTLSVLHTGGTAIPGALAVKTSGTLVIAPQGTATGSLKEQVPAIVEGRNLTFPYKDVATLDVTFREQAAPTEGIY